MRSRIILAYSNAVTDPVALQAVRRALPRGAREVIECKGADGYGKLFRELWLAGKPFILVEHDVVPGPGMIEMLDGCASPFCAHGYGPSDHLPDSGALLGLAHFRPVGDVPYETMRTDEAVNGVPRFDALANVVYRSLAARGQTVHQHTPPVTHLDRWDMLPEGEPGPPDAMAPLEKVTPPGFRRGMFVRPEDMPPAPLPPPVHDPAAIVDTTPKK